MTALNSRWCRPNIMHAVVCLPKKCLQHLPKKYPQHLPKHCSQHLPKKHSQHLPKKYPQHLPKKTLQHCPDNCSQQVTAALPEICCGVSRPLPTGSAAGGCMAAPGSWLSSTCVASTATAACGGCRDAASDAASFFSLLLSAEACLACLCSSRSLQTGTLLSLMLQTMLGIYSDRSK